MRELLVRVWILPWPPRLRKLGDELIKRMWLQRLVVPHFLVGVIGIIENERGEVLLLRHTYRTQYPWGLPTGFLEHWEQPAAALLREIHEETGMRVQLLSGTTIYSDPKRPLLNIVFRGCYLGGDFTASAEVSQARFYPRHDLPPLIPDQRRLLREVIHERPDGGGSELL